MCDDSHHRQMSNQKNKKSNSRNNNRRYGRGKNKSKNHQRNQSPGHRNQVSGQKKLSQNDKIVKSYYVFIEKLQIARRKYYDDFHHKDPNRVKKLRRNFERTVEEFSIWESKLSPEEANLIRSEKNSKDFDYSTQKKLPQEGHNEISDSDISDPHLISKQEQAKQQYQEDEEETVGTMDDYRSYKGIN